MARSRELWLWAGASLVAAGAALGGVAGALVAARPGYRLWPSAPMVGVYLACALGLVCLWAGVRDWRFPFAVDRSDRVLGALAWLGPPVAGWVDRSELAVVVSALTSAGDRAVALTTGLVGAGGFGKTTLAARACQDPAVLRRFPGGVCWVTVGRDLDEEHLAQRISETVRNLGGEGPAFTSVEEAGRALAGALAARPRMLLVADDVWTGGQLAPFVTAGRAGRLLVTTRRPAVLAGAGARPVEVDAMPPEVARQILARDLPQMAGQLEGDLLELAGGWPMLLGLINGRLAEDLRRGADIDAAARDAAERWRRNGPAALDIQDTQSRQLAVAATIGYSLDTLDAADQDRFCQLGIFAEDSEVPRPVITALWQATAPAGMSEADAVALCERLAGLSLVSLAWAGGSKVMVVHDVIRDFARSTLSPGRVTELNGVLLAAAAASLPAATSLNVGDGGPRLAWWELGTVDRYLRDHLIWHLIEAGRQAEAEALACDLRWAEARLAESGPAAIAADLALADTPRAARIAAAVIRVAHLLTPAEPADAVVDILHSRLAADPDWGPYVAALRDTYRRPRLVNRWPPPDLPNPAQRAVLEGHRGSVFAACEVTVAGRQLLASVGNDQTVRIWDPADGTLQAVLEGHQSVVNGVCAVTVDGRQLLASASQDRTVRIWDPATGTQQAVLKGHQGWVEAVCAVTVAGRQLLASASYDRTVRMWDPATGTEQAVLEGHQGAVYAVCAVTVGGRELLASAGGDAVRIWDPADGTPHLVLEGYQNEVCAVTVGGRELLASAGGDAVRIWDLADGTTPHVVLEGHRGWRGLCAVTVGGRELLASAGSDWTVRIWDPADGTQQAVLEGIPLCAVTVSGRQLLASARHYDGTMWLWDPADGTPRTVLKSHQGGVNAVCQVTVDGRRLLAIAPVGGQARDPAVRIWDPADGTQQAVLEGYQGAVSAVCPVTVAGRQLLASAGGDRTVRIWDPATGTQQAVLKGHRNWVSAVCAVTVAGRHLLASVSHDRTVRIWDPATGTQQMVLKGHHRRARAVCAVTVGGRELLASAGEDGTVRIWDPATGTRQAVLKGHQGTVNAVCTVTVAGRELLASAGDDRAVRIWDPATGHAQALIRVDRPLRACARIDPEGLAAGGEGGLYGFDILPRVHPGG